MNEFSEESFYCYCEELISGGLLLDHFRVCPARSNSRLHLCISSLLELIKDSKIAFFLEVELENEKNRIRKHRFSLLESTPKTESHPEPVAQADLSSDAPVDHQPVIPPPVVPKPTKPAGKYIVKLKCYLCSVSATSSLPCKHPFCETHCPNGICPVCCGYCGDRCETGKVRLECGHCFCLRHVVEEFEKTYRKTGVMKCFECSALIQEAEIRKVVGTDKVDSALLEIALQQGLVACVHCKTPIWLEPSPVDYKVKDSKGRIYSREAAECFAKYRFMCPECKKSQCGKCAASPYHEGLTCEQFSAPKCRYCDEQPIISLDCCGSPDCQSLLSTSCQRILPCGHRCFGVANEPTCPHCLEVSCAQGQVSGSEYCMLCGSDQYRNKPVVILTCKHVIHYACLKESLSKRWSTSRITFNFAQCPQCRDWAMPIGNNELGNEIQKYHRLYERIRDKGLERLRVEPEESKRIKDPTDKNYYGMPEKYIIDRFCYYECFKCKEVYFGGKKECEAGEIPPQNPEDFLCPNCTVSNPGFSPGVKNCPRHGIDFIEYKCRFCCSVALFYCWGTTHFCEACHKRHNAGDYMTDKKNFQLPQCPTPQACPLRIKHPPNGVEFVLGCGLCRKEAR